MKKYRKNSGTLQALDEGVIKVFSAAPSPALEELYFVKGAGLYYDGVSILKIPEDIQTNYVGEMKIFYGSVIPDKWHICDGSQFDSTVYSELYTVLGSDYLPDMRELTITCGTPNTFEDDGINHTHNKGGTGAHTHNKSGGSHTHKYTRRNERVAMNVNNAGPTTYTDAKPNTQNVAVNGTSGSNSVGNSSMNLSIGEVENCVDTVGDTTRNISVGVNYIIYMGK